MIEEGKCENQQSRHSLPQRTIPRLKGQKNKGKPKKLLKSGTKNYRRD